MTESDDKFRAPLARALKEVDRLRKKVAALEEATHEPIAIVGVGLRLPGGVVDLSTLWTALVNEVDAVRPIPVERWDADSVYDGDPDKPGKTYVREAAFLDAIDGFDPMFFNISPREARWIDPQHRLLLEAGWEALETAGIVPAALRETTTGVFVGIGPSDYGLLAGDVLDADAYEVLGTHSSFAAGRLAFTLGLQGPAVSLDTACSSSLVALHLACNSLRAGECALALAAGVQVLTAPHYFIKLARTHALARDGRCKTFSARADGYGRGEGVVLLALERLSSARANRRNVLAVIRGSAVNHDGPSSGITAPSGTSQQKVLRAALADARLAPAEIDVVECHGTGTSLGDPIEVQALASVYGQGRALSRPLLLGAIKPNIGHLESGAGLAGVAKIIAAMNHSALPATIHTQPRNHHIDWESLPVEVVDKLRSWPRAAEPRRAGVSGFGLSGTNAHVILEEAPVLTHAEPRPTLALDTGPTCLLLSGHTDAALRGQAERLHSYLDTRAHERLVDVGFSLATTRSTFAQRAVIVATTHGAAGVALDAIARSTLTRNFVRGVANVEGKLVFVFPGQGSQWPEMARALLDESAIFREQVDACDAALAAHTDWSLRSVLREQPGAASLERVDVVQPVLFAVMVSLAALWRSLGVEPDAVIGHSQGEIAAAHVAGILTLADAAKIVALRSRVIAKLSGAGAMAAVSLSATELIERLAPYGDSLALAVDNGPASTVISGDPEAVDELVARLEAEGIFARKVKVDYASHCPQIEAIRTDLLAALADVRPRQGSIPMVSTVDLGIVDGASLDGDYWYRNLRQTVRFADATSLLLQSNHRFFVEVSPHPVLPVALAGLIDSNQHTGVVVPTLRRQDGGLDRLLLSLGELHCRGHHVDWARFFAREDPRCVDLPTYAFQRQRFWLEPPKPSVVISARARREGGHPFVGHSFSMSGPEGIRYWERELSLEDLPWLGDHRVEDACLFPGAGFVEVMLAAAFENSHTQGQTLEQIQFTRALVLAPEAPVEVQVVATEVGPGAWSLTVSRKLAGSWEAHAHAHAKRTHAHADADDEETLAQVLARHDVVLDPSTAYESLAAIGLNFGPAFRPVSRMSKSSDGHSAVGLVELPEVAATAGFSVHPVLLDGCFQLVAMLTLATAGGPVVPVSIDRVEVLGSIASGSVWCETKSDGVGADGSLSASFKIWSTEGRLLCRVEGFQAEALQTTTADDPWANVLIDIRWREATELSEPMPGRWLVLGNRHGTGEVACAALESVGATVAVVAGVDPKSRQLVAQTLQNALEDAEPLQGIVVLWNLDIPSVTQVAPSASVCEPGWAGLLNLLHGLRDRSMRDPPRLVFVTHRSQALIQADDVRPEQAPLWGLVGTLRAEHAEFRPMRIDLGDPSSVEEFRSLAAFAVSDSDEDQILIRGPKRYVARFEHATMPAPVRYRTQAAAGHAYRLEVIQPGTLDSLLLVGFERRVPEHSEVEIAIEATGVNFRDVLLTAGVIPPAVKNDRVQLGFECVGRIVRIGPGVAGLELGQRVLAIALDCYATHLTVNAELVLPAPESLTAAELATLPIAHLTTYIGFHQVARLRAGERVLIHSAAGGVGIAAIQWAQHVGAEIYATAGSEAKRTWLREQGVAYVSDSRSTRFVDDIRSWTHGEGVDVVLNSLAGELMQASVGLLRSGGRFVELGLRDAYANTRLGLAPFVHNLSYNLVNLADMKSQAPGKMREAFLEMLALVRQGVLRPLPVLSHPLSKGAQVLWEMGRGTHIGKYVLTNDASESPQISIPVPIDGPILSRRSSYLLTGGLGGLGLSLAHWMAEHGAGHLVLLGRRSPERVDQLDAIAAMEQLGARVTVAAADVSVREQLAHVIEAIPPELPLAGVVHTAGVLDDGMLLNLSSDQFARVMAPKIAGAWNLHELTRGQSLDFFVLYSSAAGVLGTPGQGNYAAANTFLDALASHRRSLGLPGISIAWGPFSDVGLAAAEDIRGARLSGRGVTPLTPEQGLGLFAGLVRSGAMLAVPCPFDARRWTEYYPQATSWPALTDLLAAVPATTVGGGASVLETALRNASPAEASRLIVEHVVGELAQVVRMDSSQLDPETPFAALGVDSLMGVELRNRLEVSTSQSLPSTAIWTYPTPRALATYLLDRITAEPRPKSPAPPNAGDDVPESAALREQLEEISDADLLALGEDLLS
jgi:acyl transferase domain-containing protein/NADPH:quinone reductase-like Zn-dependent oxidoreductase/acyl carrier protein